MCYFIELFFIKIKFIQITIAERSAEDNFVILACDGVWDVMKNQEIGKHVNLLRNTFVLNYSFNIICPVDFVQSNLLKYPDLGMLCEAVLDECLKLNSRDNMTVLYIYIQIHAHIHTI